MSVVVAYQSPYGLIMGSDCAVTDDTGFQMPGEPKVWAVGDMLYGLVGDGDIFTRIRYGTVWPGKIDSSPVEDYCIDHVLPRVEMVTDGVEDAGWELLIGHPMGLCYVAGGSGAFFPREPFMAIGTGGQYAMACLEMMHESCLIDPREMCCLADAEAIVEAALLRACNRNAYCGLPIVILSLEGQ